MPSLVPVAALVWVALNPATTGGSSIHGAMSRQ